MCCKVSLVIILNQFLSESFHESRVTVERPVNARVNAKRSADSRNEREKNRTTSPRLLIISRVSHYTHVRARARALSSICRLAKRYSADAQSEDAQMNKQ